VRLEEVEWIGVGWRIMRMMEARNGWKHGRKHGKDGMRWNENSANAGKDIHKVITNGGLSPTDKNKRSNGNGNTVPLKKQGY
jgi:hypothetical protein